MNSRRDLTICLSHADLYSYFVGQLPAGARKKLVLVVIKVNEWLQYDPWCCYSSTLFLHMFPVVCNIEGRKHCLISYRILMLLDNCTY